MRVVIVSDSALGAESIRWCFKYAPNLEVIGYLDGRRPCAPGVRSSGADMVVMDETEVRRTLLERIAELHDAVPATKLVLLTRTMDRAALDEAFRAGIDAAISRDIDPASLGILVRQIGLGAVFHSFARSVAAELRADPRADLLTAREWEILRLVAHGNSNSRVAATLWVTEQTVKFHLSNIYRKLGVANRTEASHWAHTHGLLSADAPQDRHRPGRGLSTADSMEAIKLNGLQASADRLGTSRPAGRFRTKTTLEEASSPDPTLMRAIARAKEGDSEAVRFLYLRYADNVYGYVRSIVRDDYEAEDVTQHVFAKLITVIDKYEQRTVPFSAWILRLARNAAIDHMRAPACGPRRRGLRQRRARAGGQRGPRARVAQRARDAARRAARRGRPAPSRRASRPTRDRRAARQDRAARSTACTTAAGPRCAAS